MKKVLIIVQARIGSTRFPGKTMKKILGIPMIHYVVERLKMSKEAHSLVVALPTNKKDNIIEDFCKKSRINFFRGSEQDVLKRFYDCARKYKGDIIVRVSGDSPLIDPKIVDDMIRNFTKCDYMSNALKPFLPKGIDFEIFTFNALKRAHLNAKKLVDREHVTKYIYHNRKKFKIKEMYPEKILYRPDIKLTVDTATDFQLVSSIFKELYNKKKNFETKDIIHLLEKKPELYLKKIKKKVKIIIRADASRKYGMGHFNKCFNLYQELKKIKQFDISFGVRTYPGYQESLKRLKKKEYFLIDEDRANEDEIKLLKKHNPDFVIVDLDYRSVNQSYYNKITGTFPTIIIEDMGNLKVNPKVIISASIVEERQNFQTVGETPVFAGTDYMILNKGFGTYHKKNKKIRNKVSKVLVSIGGGDPNNHIEKILKVLKDKKVKVTVILGEAYKNKDEIKSQYKNYNIKVGINNMYKLMFDADIIICSGGVTLYEANSIGVPSVVIPQNIEEAVTGKRFQQHGSSILIKKITKKEISKTLNLSKQKRKQMSKIGKTLVDGNGSKRMKDIIAFSIINEINPV